MAVKHYGTARVDVNGKSVILSEKVTIKEGTYIDDDGNHYTLEKIQPFSPNTAHAKLTSFSPEITIPILAKEGWDLHEITNLLRQNLNITSGGFTYAIVGGFNIADGAETDTEDGKVTPLIITGGIFRKI